MAEIRKIKTADLKRIIEITEKAFPDKWPQWYFESLLQEYPDDFYVSEINGEIMGYVLGLIKENKYGWIKAIAVHPDSQGKGLGTELMDFVTNRLKESGAKTIGLHARTNNEKGVSFYKNRGFRAVKTVEKYYSDGDSALLMEKSL